MKQQPKKRSKLTLFQCLVCLCLAAMAASLYTPYPAMLVRALREPHTQPPTTNTAGKPDVQKPTRRTTEKEPLIKNDSVTTKVQKPTQPAPVKEPPPPAPPIVTLNTPLMPERSIALPAVNYPPFPPVMPHKIPEGTMTNVNELTRGLNLKTQINFIPGTTAATDRKIKSNYQVTLSMNVKQPKAATGKKELLTLSPKLDKILPDLDLLMANAKVSPFFTQLYTRKQTHLRKNLASLNNLLSRHNFYDTETILEITHPESKRKVLWLQSEMDVVSDGSDGDRLRSMPDKILNSAYYQPSTSYRWEKLTDNPNPLLKPWQDRLAKYKDELKKAPSAKKNAIRDKINHAQRIIVELKRYSFLISEYDPFIVVPLGVVNQASAFSPRFGDYAVVIANGKLYPALVGDAGPRYKTGEASLRLSRAINRQAGPYSRPVSDLTVSYLIFPNSADEKAGPPDYKRMTEKCRALMNEIGGIGQGYDLHLWEDQLAPKTPSAEKSSPQ